MPRHDPTCPVVQQRADLNRLIVADPTNEYLQGARIEYYHGGDQEVEECRCSAYFNKENDVNLMICIDGVEHATLALKDGDDAYNQSVERGALDRAYEAKESNPDAVVTIVIDREEEELVALRMSKEELQYISDNLTLLAGVDEGENTDYDRLIRVAAELETLALP